MCQRTAYDCTMASALGSSCSSAFRSICSVCTSGGSAPHASTRNAPSDGPIDPRSLNRADPGAVTVRDRNIFTAARMLEILCNLAGERREHPAVVSRCCNGQRCNDACNELAFGIAPCSRHPHLLVPAGLISFTNLPPTMDSRRTASGRGHSPSGPSLDGVEPFEREVARALALEGRPTPELHRQTLEFVEQCRRAGRTHAEVRARIAEVVRSRLPEASYNAPARRAALTELLSHWARPVRRQPVGDQTRPGDVPVTG